MIFANPSNLANVGSYLSPDAQSVFYTDHKQVEEIDQIIEAAVKEAKE